MVCSDPSTGVFGIIVSGLDLFCPTHHLGTLFPAVLHHENNVDEIFLKTSKEKS